VSLFTTDTAANIPLINNSQYLN